ncbi:MAG: hypothetical protein JST55_12080 [Bacteroidetes bacterium]|nr:hypothetical protein [Bacteroidota bacterium]
MKKKLIISFVILLLILSFAKIFILKGAENNLSGNESYKIPFRAVKYSQSTPREDNRFLIGALDDAWDRNYSHIRSELKFNFWQKYTNPTLNYNDANDFGKNWIDIPGDKFEAPVSDYASDVFNKIHQNSDSGLYTFIDRSKIQYLCFGQRSDYQCEKINAEDDYGFYAYDTSLADGVRFTDIKDNSYDGGGEIVKKCLHSPIAGANAQYIVKGLRANEEQTNNFWPYSYIGDQLYDWYILPRVRIDASFANDAGNYERRVCKVVIKNMKGNDSLIQILRVRNFKGGKDSLYDGNYKEQYYFQEGDTNNLFISQKDKPLWFNNDGNYGGKSYVDFKVYWYDNCDMWIDYVRVENTPAHRLLTMHEKKLTDWLEGEIKLAYSALQTGYKTGDFYIEEFSFNHMPSMKFVNHMIDSLTGHRLSLLCNYNHDMFKQFRFEDWGYTFTPAQIKKYLVDYLGIKSVLTQCYNFEGWDKEHFYKMPAARESTIPYTLKDNKFDEAKLTLGRYPLSPDAYDDWLQQNLDDTKMNRYALSLTYILKHSQEISGLSSIPFYYMPQAHLWSYPTHFLREPTNEEAELTNALAVSYGAKGILYFWYGYVEDSKTHARGLCNPPEPGTNYPSPRYINSYGQPKWEKYKSMNELLLKWEPYIMSFDYTGKSYIYQSEKNALRDETFINDLITYRPENTGCSEGSAPAGTFAECPEKRYIQAAVFNNPSERDAKFFMIVNRRCSPVTAGNPDGRRYVRLKYGKGKLNNYNNWKVIDLGTNTIVTTFDKRNIESIDLGWFNPGEGKLFKLEPVS